MLSVAADKNTDGSILFLNQDICEFELYGTVDVFLSMLDTVNYIVDEDSLKEMFKLVNNYLNSGGVFIFDVNTKYKFEKILGNNDLVYESGNIFYTWENYYEDELLDFRLNFFVKSSDGTTYNRITENHSQRFYSSEFLKNVASDSGLEFCAIYGDVKDSLPDNNEERIYMVFKKPIT